MYKNTTNETDLDILQNLTVPPYILVYIVLFAISAILGVIGNFVIIIAICISKVLRDIKNAFIFNLAFADLTVSGVTMPMSILGVLLGKQWFEINDSLCQLSAIVCAPGCVASTYSICFIAISRYFYICKYNFYIKHFTKWRVFSYVVAIWALSFFVHMPNHIGWGMVRFSSNFQFCTFDADHISYSMYYASFLFLAIVVTAVFYVKLYLVIRTTILPRQLLIGKKQQSLKNALMNNNVSSEMTVRDELRLAKASFKIFVAFLIFWAPVVVLILLTMGDKIPSWAYLYAALAAHSNSTLNVFIYYFENKTFRRAIKLIFRKKYRSNDASNSFMSNSKSTMKFTFHQTNRMAVQYV